jgi:hypothetical protein
MKSLVYENYNKFISATDTIRKVIFYFCFYFLCCAVLTRAVARRDCGCVFLLPCFPFLSLSEMFEESNMRGLLSVHKLTKQINESNVLYLPLTFPVLSF